MRETTQPSIAPGLEDVTVLIPAAGRVPEGLLALSNIVCPAMIPVGGRPVIHWTLSYLRSLGARRFIIAVARRGMFVEDFVACAFGGDCEIQFMTPSQDGGVGTTIAELAELAETPRALVVLGDTHFQFTDPAVLQADHTVVLTHPVEDSYRWCIAETAADGTIARLRDKEHGLEGTLKALIGVYYFPHTAALRGAARANATDAQQRGGRAEIAGILRRLQETAAIHAVGAASWLDCGNADMQARAHQTLLQARAFNRVSIDPTLGTLTKRSQDSGKFVNEINYLRLLPADLAVLFPRVLGFSTAWERPWIEMEYYGYPSLSEVFLFENVDAGVWQRVFAHLRAIVRDRFGKHVRPLPAGALRTMYLDKTRERLQRLPAEGALGALIARDEVLVINGRPTPQIATLWPRIEQAIAALDRSAVGTIVHGDFCLSNILYDLRSRICRLIDPRGSFGEVGLYGDPRYDIAKLWHSVHGLYDFIVNDLFDITVVGSTVDLQIRSTPAHRDIEHRFETIFFNGAYVRRDIQLIAALLFASMPALHYDSPRRQLAMYARSLQLLDEYFAAT